MVATPNPQVDPAVDAPSPTGWRLWLQRLTRDSQGRSRLAAFGAILVVGFVAAAALLSAFAWLASEVLDQETAALDNATLQFLQRFSSPQLTLVANLISAMGSQVVVAVGAALLVTFFWQRRWGAAVSLIVVTAGAQLLNDVLKADFHRTRPTPVGGLIEAQQYSFPSGHAMVSAAFYFFVAYLAWRLVHHRWKKAAIVTTLLLLVALIGLARLYLEAHFLSDVIAGYLAGFLWTDAVIVGGRVLTMRTHRQPTPAPQNRPLQTH